MGRWMDLFNRYFFVEYVPGNFQELEIQLTLTITIY